MSDEFVYVINALAQPIPEVTRYYLRRRNAASFTVFKRHGQETIRRKIGLEFTSSAQEANSRVQQIISFRKKALLASISTIDDVQSNGVKIEEVPKLK